MVSCDFNKAKTGMEFTLRGLKQEIYGDHVLGVKVPFDHSRLVAKGTNSLVFSLPGSGLVGKSSFYDTVCYDKQPGYYMLAGYSSGLTADGLRMTVDSLREMGFDKKTGLVIPEMQEHGCKVNMWHHKVVYYTLMPDLREGGKYQLKDAEGFSFGSHGFGSDLRRLYEETCEEVLHACGSGRYKLTCAGHGSEEDPSPAVKHMFLVQFNDTEGNLCIADLNHLVIRKR